MKIQKLIQYIKENGEITYNQAKVFAENLDINWRTETWTRGLRRADDIICLHKDEKVLNSPTIAYRYKNAFEATTTPRTSPVVQDTLFKLKPIRPN